MRVIDWMKPYKEKYERFLNTGNPNTDAGNAILLHSEGNGSQFPLIFAIDNAEEIAAKNAAAQAAANQPQQSTAFAQPQSAQTPAGGGMPPMPGAPAMPPMPGMTPPAPAPEPEIALYIAVAGQQYGPLNRELCKQMVKSGQLTEQSTVWMEGLSAWTAAGQVPMLKSLFAPQMPPSMPGAPGMPPIPPTMPPM